MTRFATEVQPLPERAPARLLHVSARRRLRTAS
jgi:hypothetical protein